MFGPARNLALFTLLGAGLLAPARGGEPDVRADFFEKRIRPVLVARCYECHGPEKVQGGLRLDSRQGWETGGDSGPTIMPGEPAESLLVQALRHDPNFVEMPPDGQLAEAVIRDFERWISDGAFDPREVQPAATEEPAAPKEKHWAYQPVVRSGPPAVRDASWPKSEIDRFVLARLEAKNLRPSKDAEREVLARRLYFDLIGLPPTPEQLDTFARDDSADAVERLVDELLASPHFGERWGRHWLDVVRFGESFTLRGLIQHDAWRYRDYVIEFFNADRGFDQFVREQVAGDLLESDSVAERQRQCIATTFYALGNWNLEEQDKKQLRLDVVDEQLDTLGKAFLAQTIGCARCHDHKFDPIPTREYHALAAILRNIQTLEDANVSKWLTRPLPVEPEEESVLAAHESILVELDKQVAAQTKILAELEGKTGPNVLAADQLPGVVVDDVAARQVGLWTASSSNKPYIGRGYLHDGNDRQGEKTLTFEAKLPSPGRYEVRLAYTHSGNRATNTLVTVFSAEGEATSRINQRERPAIEGRFVSLGDFRFEEGGQSFVIVANDDADGHVVADAVQFLPVDETREGGSATELASTIEDQSRDKAAIAAARANLNDAKRRLNELKKSGPSRPTYLAVVEREEIEEAHVYVRGNVHQLGEPVSRGFLNAIWSSEPVAMPVNESGRRELAQWLTDPANPLTARVIVNRVWHWMFGAGLARTVDNLGTTGEAPSHPELLDCLAAEFMADGWSVKRLVRRIALSRVYQLSAEPPEGSEVDPENRLLSHATRRRLDAESLRDAMLSASGELDLASGGPTIRPDLAADYGYEHSDTRRSVYTPVLRNSLPSIFEAFDFADPGLPTGARSTSTVSQQALFFLHDPFALTRAKQTGGRVAAIEGPVDERIVWLFRATLGRTPRPAELELARESVRSGGSENEPEAWSGLAQALFASIEFRYLD